MLTGETSSAQLLSSIAWRTWLLRYMEQTTAAAPYVSFRSSMPATEGYEEETGKLHEQQQEAAGGSRRQLASVWWWPRTQRCTGNLIPKARRRRPYIAHSSSTLLSPKDNQSVPTRGPAELAAYLWRTHLILSAAAPSTLLSYY